MFYDMDFSNWSNSEDTDKNSTLVKREFEEWTDDPDNRQLRDVDIEMPINNHLRDEFDEFARAITEDDVEPEIGARAAMRNVAVVKAAQTSARENRPVTVEEIIENA
ncbi:Gfo/Idh/MocA family oxidoreductase [Halomicroarcula sp. GCM10025710]